MKKLFYAISLILLSSLIIPSANFRTASAQSTQLILFWDNNSATPSGWTCISDIGDEFFEVFPRGAPSYGGTGGSLTHTHTAGVVSCSPPSTTTPCRSGLLPRSGPTHTHTSATTIPASNLPLRRGLRIIRCDTGIPATIPAGAIALFDSEPLPPGWTRYSAQDGRFVQGVAIAGMVIGSNTHNHIVNSSVPSPTINAGIGLIGLVNVANNIHVHSGTSDTQSNEPPYIEIILAQADSDTSIPRGMIGMFNESPGGCWNVMSDIGGVLYHRFIRGSSIYGATGGSESHSHANLTITTPTLLPIQLVRTGADISVGSAAHTHNIIVSFSSDSNLPPYRDVIFAELGIVTAQPSSNSPVCEGSTINLIGGPDGMTTYTWYGPGGWTSTDRNPTRTADNTTAGTYYLSVVNSNGCTSDNATVSVIVNPLPAVDAGSDQQTCQRAGPIALTGETPIGGTWSGTGVSGSQFDPDSLLPGAYSVMYTYTNLAGCSNSDNKTVTINPLPDCTITAPLAVCTNSTGNIASVPDAGAGATYSWTITNGTIIGSSDNNSITWNAGSASPVTIGINILNSFGCSCSNKGINITVNPLPAATASGDSPVCVGDTIQLAGGSDNMTSYSWTGPNGFTSNQQSPSIPKATTTMSGNYFITVTDTNGCTSNPATVAVSVVTCGGGGGAGDSGVGVTTAGINCPLALALNMEGNTTTTGISVTGVLCETCIARDSSGKYVLELGKDTQIMLAGNTIPLLLRFHESSNPPPAPENTAIIGPVYEISAYPTAYITSPSPVTISPPAILTLPYDPKELPENMTEVYIADYDVTKGWLALASVPGVVAELGKAQGLASHFSTFAVLAKVAKSEQAKFEVSNLTISPYQVKPNKEVAVSIKLTNIGGKSGDYGLQLKVDGILKSSKQVTVPADTSQTINFTIKESATGKHHLDVAGQTGEFVVSSPPFKFNWWLIEGILFAIMLGLAAWMMIKLRSV